MQHFTFNTICAITLTTLIGCDATGPRAKLNNPDADLVPCAGIVLLDGKPLADAEIRMKNSRGLSFGKTDKNGRFRMKSSYLSLSHDGARSGTTSVAVLKRVPIDSEEKDAKHENILPKKYQYPETSGITLVIPLDGTEDAVIEISSDPDSDSAESADDSKTEHPAGED